MFISIYKHVEHSNGIDLPRLRPLEVLHLVISSVGKHGASVFSCVKFSLRSCKRIWLATSASFLRFGSSFCSFEKNINMCCNNGNG